MFVKRFLSIRVAAFFCVFFFFFLVFYLQLKLFVTWHTVRLFYYPHTCIHTYVCILIDSLLFQTKCLNIYIYICMYIYMCICLRNIYYHLVCIFICLLFCLLFLLFLVPFFFKVSGSIQCIDYIYFRLFVCLLGFIVLFLGKIIFSPHLNKEFHKWVWSSK